MNQREKRLMDEVPLMKCGNKLEFKQRLQWLSEGMLHHNLSGGGWPPNLTEIETYQRYKDSTDEQLVQAAAKPITHAELVATKFKLGRLINHCTGVYRMSETEVEEHKRDILDVVGQINQR